LLESAIKATGRNRRASDYLQEDQRDRQTDLPLFLLLFTVSSRRMYKVARTSSQHQSALFGGFTPGIQWRSSTPCFSSQSSEILIWLLLTQTFESPCIGVTPVDNTPAKVAQL